MNINPPRAWLACFVTRWHSGNCAPWLAKTNDVIHGHGGRMAILAQVAFRENCSSALIIACVNHDMGEYGTCDAPMAVKADPVVKERLDHLEELELAALGLDYQLSDVDCRRLKFLDRWDSYLWAQHHAPQLMDRADWVEAGRYLLRTAYELRVEM